MVPVLRELKLQKENPKILEFLLLILLFRLFAIEILRTIIVYI